MVDDAPDSYLPEWLSAVAIAFHGVTIYHEGAQRQRKYNALFGKINSKRHSAIARAAIGETFRIPDSTDPEKLLAASQSRSQLH